METGIFLSTYLDTWWSSLTLSNKVMLGTAWKDNERRSRKWKRSGWGFYYLLLACINRGSLCYGVCKRPHKRLWTCSMTLCFPDILLSSLAGLFCHWIDYKGIHPGRLIIENHGWTITAYILGEAVNFACIAASSVMAYSASLVTSYIQVVKFYNYPLSFYILQNDV